MDDKAYNCFLFFSKLLNQPLGELLERKESIACAEKSIASALSFKEISLKMTIIVEEGSVLTAYILQSFLKLFVQLFVQIISPHEKSYMQMYVF